VAVAVKTPPLLRDRLLDLLFFDDAFDLAASSWGASSVFEFSFPPPPSPPPPRSVLPPDPPRFPLPPFNTAATAGVVARGRFELTLPRLVEEEVEEIFRQAPSVPFLGLILLPPAGLALCGLNAPPTDVVLYSALVCFVFLIFFPRFTVDSFCML
jgi:hypothetical protein